MAIRGRKPTPNVVKLVTGTARTDRMQPDGPDPSGKPVKPNWLTGRGAELWAEVMAFATWLTPADAYKLAAWCDRQAEFEVSRHAWTAADRREHRASGSEIGLDPASRHRLAGAGPMTPMPKREGDEYFSA